jgi:hypothetical protein
MLDSTAPGTVAQSSVNKLVATFKAERATELAKIAQAQPDNQNAQAEARKAQAEADKAAAKLVERETEPAKPSSKLPKGAGIDDVPAFIYDRVASSEAPALRECGLYWSFENHPQWLQGTQSGTAQNQCFILIPGRGEEATATRADFLPRAASGAGSAPPSF